jgi:hypothetical protein
MTAVEAIFLPPPPRSFEAGEDAVGFQGPGPPVSSSEETDRNDCRLDRTA